MDKVNLAQKFSLFDAHWSPKLIGELKVYELEDTNPF